MSRSPTSSGADELLQYLDDLFHEDATPRHPAVVEMPPPAP
ncbi:DUF7661 family protein [Burkholderia gladioli]